MAIRQPLASLGQSVFLVFASVIPFAIPPAAHATETSRLEVTRHVLNNGMRFLIVPWGDAPVVMTYIRFDVGGADDPKGLTGVAHLLEHMMFKGTTTLGTTDWEAERPWHQKLIALWQERERRTRTGADAAKLAEIDTEIRETRAAQDQFVVKNEIWQIYERCGGSGLNASTDNDSTQYFVQLPSNQLEVWARVESDRIAHPVFREFYSERDVVHEERRLRTDSNARGIFGELFDMHAFLVHPYRQPVVGWPEDIDSTDHDQVLAYFKTWYAPNNCVVVLVGDVEPQQTIALVEKYFGSLPAQPLPRRTVTPEPKQLGERRFQVELDGETQVDAAWHVPALGHADAAALTVAARVLNGGGGGGGGFGRFGGGAGGRLRTKLVDELKLARRASAQVGFGKYPGLFHVTATPARERTIAELEPAIYAEIERLATEPPTEGELKRIKTAVASQAVRGLNSATAIARSLAEAEALTGDWREIERGRERLLAVTADDVARVVRSYLRATNRTVGIAIGPPEPAPEEPADRGTAPQEPNR